jgi:hypothetical protein
MWGIQRIAYGKVKLHTGGLIVMSGFPNPLVVLGYLDVLRVLLVLSMSCALSLLVVLSLSLDTFLH